MVEFTLVPLSGPYANRFLKAWLPSKEWRVRDSNVSQARSVLRIQAWSSGTFTVEIAGIEPLQGIPTPFPAAGIPIASKNPFIRNGSIAVCRLVSIPDFHALEPLTRLPAPRGLEGRARRERGGASAPDEFTDGTG